MEDLIKLKDAQIEALQKEIAKKDAVLKKAIELMKEFLSNFNVLDYEENEEFY